MAFTINNISASSVTYQGQTIAAGNSFTTADVGISFATDILLRTDIITGNCTITVGTQTYAYDTALKILQIVPYEGLQGVSGTVSVNIIGASIIQGVSGTVNISGVSGTTNVSIVGATITQGVSGTVNVVGNVAAGTTDSGNGVKISGLFTTVLPTITSGQRGDLPLDSSTRPIISPLTNASIVKSQLQDNSGAAVLLGQKLMVSGIPMVLSSDQTGINSFLDKSGSGALTALNQAVTIATNGLATVTVQQLGTYVATASFEASVDNGTTWFSVTGIYLNVSQIPISALASTGQVLFYVAAYTNFRVRISAYTSGTVNVVINGGSGSLSNIATQFTRIADNIGQFITSTTQASKILTDTAAQGNIANAATDSGNPVKVGGVFHTTLPTVADGQRGDLQIDGNSRLIAVSVPVDGTKFSYSAAAVAVTPAAASTDIFTISGSGTKTIRVTRVEFSGTTTAGSGNTTTISLIKRSAANTGGTSSALTKVSHDSSDTASTATVLNYTANPTALGTAVGTVRSSRISVATVGATPTILVWDFSRPTKAIVLRGTNELLCINLNAGTITAPVVSISIEWTEE